MHACRSTLEDPTETEGEDSPSVSDNLGTLADIAYLQGRSDEAERLYRSRLAIDERVLGPDHPDVATTLNNLGRILIERREFAGAEPLLDRAVRNALRERGATHDDMAFLLANLALARQGLGRTAEAEELFEQARVAAQEHGNRMLAPIMTDLAAIACGDNRLARGMQLLEEARPIMQGDYPDDAWRTAWLDSVMAECRWRAGEHEAARSLFGSVAPTIAQRWGPATLFGGATTKRQSLISAN